MGVIRFDNKGWRARFEQGFNSDNVSRVADAFAYIWAEASPGATVYVGYDTRYDGRRLAEVAAGVAATYGLRAVLSDEACPTPALGWATARDADAVGAIMLTASSASCEFGGITVRGVDGGPVSEEFYDAASRIVSAAPIHDRGAYERADLNNPYLQNLIERTDVELVGRAAPSVVVDALYGSGSGRLSALLRAMGCKVHEIHSESLADFGGLHPRVEEPWVDQCEQAVLAYGADIGLVLDGDADRVGVVDNAGHFVPPYKTVPLVMCRLVEGRGLRGRVVATHSSSAFVRREAERLSLPFTAVPMGFSRIYNEFVERDVLMGTEELGGVCCPTYLPERDGLMAAVLVVEYLAQRGEPLTNILDDLEDQLGTLHYLRRDIRLDAAAVQAFRNMLPGLSLSEVCGMHPVQVSHADGLVMRFDDDSWVQLRPSRTEPVVRVSAEASSPAKAEALADESCSGILAFLPR